MPLRKLKTDELPLFQTVNQKFIVESYTKGKSNLASFEKLQLEKSLKIKAEQVSLFDFVDIAFPKAQGYFCIFQKGEERHRNDFYTRTEFVKKLTALFEKTWGMNAYISYSTYYKSFRGIETVEEPVRFKVDGTVLQSTACDIETKTEYVIKKKKRKKQEVRVQENIQYTYMAAQDLDFYKLGITESQAVETISQLIIKGEIVCPTFFVFTGRGIQLIWTVKPFKNVQGYTNDLAWRQIQDRMIAIFDQAGLNPDTVVKAPSAVTRLPQTVNRKSNTLVKAFYMNSYPLTLHDMVLFHDILPYGDRKVESPKPQEIERLKEQHQQSIALPKETQRESKVAKLKNWNDYTLNRYREEDIFIFAKEAIKKGYDITGKRTWLATVLCFHALVSSGGDETYAFNRVEEFWELLEELRFDHDNSLKEMKERASIALKYYDEWVNDTWNRSKYVQGGLFYKNETMLKYLKIEEDYYIQWKMNTIKVKNNKYEAARKHFERLEQGKIQGTMAEYNERRKEGKEDKLWLLQRAMEQHPKAKRDELAKMLGVSGPRITQLKKELKK